MINTIYSINELATWFNIAPLTHGKNYQLKFTVSDFCSVSMHIHRADGACIYSLGLPGTAMVPGVEYKYTFTCKDDGYLAIRTNAGSINDISVEVIER